MLFQDILGKEEGKWYSSTSFILASFQLQVKIPKKQTSKRINYNTLQNPPYKVYFLLSVAYWSKQNYQFKQGASSPCFWLRDLYEHSLGKLKLQ